MIKNINFKYKNKADLYNAKQSLLGHPTEQILIQVFSGIIEKVRIETLLKELKEAFPHTPIIGTTTAGEILNGAVHDNTVIISISIFQCTTVRTRLESNNNLSVTGNNIGDKYKDTPPTALILFGCGLKNKRTIDATAMLSAIYTKLPNVVIAGAQAGDNGEGENTFVFTEDGVTDTGVVAAGLSGKNLVVNNSYNLSWIPIGKKMTITKVDGPRVYSIDDQSPYELYSHYLGKEVADGLPLSAADFPLIIKRNNIPMAIHAIGVNDDGSFEYIHSFTPGEQLQFGFCHAGLLAIGARETYSYLKCKQVQAAFIYSCVSRKWILGSDINIEVSPVAKLAPTSGFFAYGEYFTFPKQKNCLFLSQTMTVLTLAERGEPETVVIHEDLPLHITDEESKQLKTLRVLHRLVETSTRELESINEELDQMAHKDSLTGLSNRRYFDEQLENEFNRTVRTKNPISLIMMDIDYFKLFNDTYGHVDGDSCLRGVALAFKKAVQRPIDIIARYGGEEFICILPNTDFNGAMFIAEKIRIKVESLSIKHKNSSISDYVTTSIGVITMSKHVKDITPVRLVDACDKQLYTAKSHGRNRVIGMDMD